MAKHESAHEDRELVARMAEGDQLALSALYDRFAGLLLGLSKKILGSLEEAEDVVQDVFVQAWQQANRYDPGKSSVSTWLVLITRSRSIDRLRTRRVVDRTALSAHHENPLRDTSPEGVSNVLNAERGERLRGELAALPDSQRSVLELAFFEGLTQSEISTREGIPLGTVKTRTLLAMRKLRAALADDLRELL